MRRQTKPVKLTTYEDLLGIEDAGNSAEQPSMHTEGQIVRLPLNIMHEFEGHPFRVSQDAKMAETVESVKKYGVLEPGIVRKHKLYPGQYEIIAGHRRCLASELAGYSDMPVIIMDLTDDEATVIMVDSNIQREDLLSSEKAWAYRMKYDALKRMGAESGQRNDSVLAKEAGESRNTIQRYIRLTYLIPGLLQIVDEGKLPHTSAADISFLSEEEQEQLLEIMDVQSLIPSGRQAAQMKELSKAGKLSPGAMLHLMLKKEDPAKFTLKNKDIRRFFPETYTGKQIEETIFRLLQEWKEQNA